MQQNKPFYLLIAEWMLSQKRWISASDIVEEFNIMPNSATNYVTYIINSVPGIKYDVKYIRNDICGRGCRCRRLVIITEIAPEIYNSQPTARNHLQHKKNLKVFRLEELIKSKRRHNSLKQPQNKIKMKE